MYAITRQVVSLFLLVAVISNIKDNYYHENTNIFIHRYRTAAPSPKVEEERHEKQKRLAYTA